jgi:hypothetical protein
MASRLRILSNLKVKLETGVAWIVGFSSSSSSSSVPPPSPTAAAAAALLPPLITVVAFVNCLHFSGSSSSSLQPNYEEEAGKNNLTTHNLFQQKCSVKRKSNELSLSL